MLLKIKQAAWGLWIVLALVFNEIEVRVFHSDTDIGITLGAIVGLYLGFLVNGRPIQTETLSKIHTV